MREFIALNKYLLEAANHKQYINTAKAKFLDIAMSRLNEQKEKDIKNQFQSINENNSLNAADKLNTKVEQLLDIGPELKEMFYKCYYQIKKNSNNN